jgi:hypothetical protein
MCTAFCSPSGVMWFTSCTLFTAAGSTPRNTERHYRTCAATAPGVLPSFRMFRKCLTLKGRGPAAPCRFATPCEARSSAGKAQMLATIGSYSQIHRVSTNCA